MLRPDDGTVQVDGPSLWPDTSSTKRLVGLAPQDLGAYPVLSTRETFLLLGELAGRRGSIPSVVVLVCAAIVLAVVARLRFRVDERKLDWA